MNKEPKRWFLISLFLILSAACGPEDPAQNHQGSDASLPDFDSDLEPLDRSAQIDALRDALSSQKIEPLSSPEEEISPQKVELGRLLFFEPELSGMRDTSCATCHRMDAGTSDGVSLPVGAGAVTTDGVRTPGPELPFMTRNSPDLFNRGHQDWTTMFWDSRMEALEDGAIVVHDRYPDYAPGNYFRVLPDEAENILAAQSIFPMIGRREMRGQPGSLDIFGEENELGFISSTDVESIWIALVRRIRAIPEYAPFLEEAFPDRPSEELTVFDLGNAMAAFMIDAFTFDDSPFNLFLKGDDDALSQEELQGALLFFGQANCASCHTGSLLTDQRIYNLAIPPMTRGPEPLSNMDFGAAHRSHAGPNQNFYFRTPPLHNVEITAPYFHNGSALTLRDVLIHKSDPLRGLWEYDPSRLSPEFQAQVHQNPENIQKVEATLSPAATLVPSLDDEEIDALVAFLKSLTSPSARSLEHLVPDSTPSGLPLNLP